MNRSDLVFQFVMFSSILNEPTKAQIAREMVRVLKPGGFVVWYDFFRDNPWSRDVRGVRKKKFCSCFRNASRIFEGSACFRH